jgi:signal transduction histidine kinase
LFNIINNAIKYNQHHGSITIADSTLQSRYRVDIIDTGIGMNREQIEKAFNRFEKLDTDEKESFGLGLAIVKSIASFHDININITSEKNQGTTFTLIFNEQANFTKSSS